MQPHSKHRIQVKASGFGSSEDEEETVDNRTQIDQNINETLDLLTKTAIDMTVIKAADPSLAMPLPLVAAGHSLAADMQFGWKPQADKDIPPIPLCFGLVYYNLEQFNYPKVLYVGPRYKNSYKMHEQYANKLMKLPIQRANGEDMSVFAYPFTFPKFYNSNNFTYEEAFDSFVESLENDCSILDQDLSFHLTSTVAEQRLKETATTYQRRQPQPNSNSLLHYIQQKTTNLEKEDFIFDSNFESGNLDFVGKVAENEYDMLMRLDSNSRSHLQWFYFSIDCKDIRRRDTKGETIKINIINFTKPNTLYNQGMRPVAWSKQKCMSEGIGWHRVGQNIVYKMSKLNRQNQISGSQRTWYQMSFEYTFEYDQDKVWFAYAIPYSYTMLCNFIKAIEQIQQKPENVKHSNIFKKEILGKSLSGVEIPILTITDFNETDKRKKTIIIVGRLHPGETHSSWVIHGLIRFLLSESFKARELRKRIVFKIVPMLNPDGVIIGNYRCTLCGFDMNRNFGGDTAAASLRLNPETNIFKTMAKQQSRLSFFFDVHSHSSKKSVFIYGPHFPLHSEHYLKIRVLPRLLAEKTSMFRYYSCRFRNELSKMYCSRLTIFRECNLPQCYTIETSIMGFLSKDRQNVSFGVPSLQYFGEKLAETLLEWFQIVEVHQREKIKKAIIMSRQRKSRKRTLIDIIGMDDYLEYEEMINFELSQEIDEFSSGIPTTNNRPKKSAKGQTRRARSKAVNSKRGNRADSETTQQMLINDQSQVNAQYDIGNNDISLQISSSKKKLKKRTGGQAGVVTGFSSEEQEEEEDDEYGNIQNNQEAQQNLKPTFHHEDVKREDGEEEDSTNKGFYVPKLAGFEYLEGPEDIKKAAKQFKEQSPNNRQNRNANADLMLSGQRSQNVEDDDEMFMYEDYANGQEGDQPLRRFEDIVGSIKKDFIKNPNPPAAGPGGSSPGGVVNDPDQFMDERDLDSDASDEEERQKKNPFDQDYEDQAKKMSQCLNTYFENIEMLQNKASIKQRPIKKSQLMQQPIQVIVKEKQPVAKVEQTSQMPKVSPLKAQRTVVKQELLIPQKKEIVFQFKKPAITNFPPEKPASVWGGQRSQGGNQYQHYRGLALSNSPNPLQINQSAQQLDPKNLSFTLMNKTHQEFFEMIQKYGDSKGSSQSSQSYNFVRAASAMAPNRQKQLNYSVSQQNQHQQASQVYQSSTNQKSSQYTTLSLGDINPVTESKHQPSSRNAQVLHQSKLTAIIPTTNQIESMSGQDAYNNHYGSIHVPSAVNASIDSSLIVRTSSMKKKMTSQKKKNTNQNLLSMLGQAQQHYSIYGGFSGSKIVPARSTKLADTSSSQYTEGSPIKGRSILEMKLSNKQSPPQKQQVIGRLGNFILMVDGKSVQGSEKKVLKTQESMLKREHKNEVYGQKNLNQQEGAEGSLKRAQTTNLGKAGRNKMNIRLPIQSEDNTQNEVQPSGDQPDQQLFHHSRHSSHSLQQYPTTAGTALTKPSFLHQHHNQKNQMNQLGDIYFSSPPIKREHYQQQKGGSNIFTHQNIAKQAKIYTSPDKKVKSEEVSRVYAQTSVKKGKQATGGGASTNSSVVVCTNEGGEQDIVLRMSNMGFDESNSPIEKDSNASSKRVQIDTANRMNSMQELKLIRSNRDFDQKELYQQSATAAVMSQREGTSRSKDALSSSPMKNQVLIDMFRQANTTTSQGGGNRSQTKRGGQQLSSRMIINISDTFNNSKKSQ